MLTLDMGGKLDTSILFEHATLPESPQVTNLKSSLNPIRLGVYGGFIIQA